MEWIKLNAGKYDRTEAAVVPGGMLVRTVVSPYFENCPETVAMCFVPVKHMRLSEWLDKHKA